MKKKKKRLKTIKPSYSERCTSIASKTETFTHDSKFFESGMSGKSGLLRRANGNHLPDKSLHFFSLDVTPFHRDKIKCFSRIKMFHKKWLLNILGAFNLKRNKKRHIKKKILFKKLTTKPPLQNIKLLSVLWKL